MRIKPSRRRLKLQHRASRHLIEAKISELGSVGTNDMGGAGAAALTLHPADLEQVAKIGAEQDIDAQAAAAPIIVANAEALVADTLPEKFGALEKDGVARELALPSSSMSGLVRSTEKAALSSWMTELKRSGRLPSSLSSRCDR